MPTTHAKYSHVHKMFVGNKGIYHTGIIFPSSLLRTKKLWNPKLRLSFLAERSAEALKGPWRLNFCHMGSRFRVCGLTY